MSLLTSNDKITYDNTENNFTNNASLNIMYVGFCLNINFRFFEMNAQECKCWVV